MKLQTFQQMLSAYGISELETDEGNEREEMLVMYPYSVLLEGGFMEFDSLEKWIKTNIGSELIKWIVYGKTGYDYAFAEYFFVDELHAKEITAVVPHIYTIYPNSYPPNHTSKSNGYDEDIVYDPRDKNAIVFGPEKSEE